MQRKLSWIVALLLLLPGVAWAQEPDEESLPEELEEEAPGVEPDERWRNLFRVEATTWALLPRAGVGTKEGYFQVEPTIIFERGKEFGVDLGTPLRLRMWGPKDGGIARREDWDELSDWGQVVRALKLGSDNSPLGVWFGQIDSYTLLSGHLVRRYAHRANPNYHPAAGVLTGTLGPVYVEAFTSDILGARLMGAEVELDLEHILFGKPEKKSRYTLATSVVHDWGRAGGRTASVTLAHLDAVAVLVIRPELEAHVFAGWGGRPGMGGAWGAVVGVGVDAETSTLDMVLRLEARHQRGGFRQGFFGADYELARFEAAGPSPVPIADAPFPNGYSLSGDAEVGWDAVSYGGPRAHLKLSLGAEVFSWGRADVDGRVAVQLFERSLEVALKGLAVGAGKSGARYLGSAEVRWRFLGGGLYAMGTGGTLLFPTAEGTLRPGAFASVGLGVDNAR